MQAGYIRTFTYFFLLSSKIVFGIYVPMMFYFSKIKIFKHFFSSHEKSVSVENSDNVQNYEEAKITVNSLVI